MRRGKSDGQNNGDGFHSKRFVNVETAEINYNGVPQSALETLLLDLY